MIAALQTFSVLSTVALVLLLAWALRMLCRQPAPLPRITRCDKPDCWCEDWIPIP